MNPYSPPGVAAAYPPPYPAASQYGAPQVDGVSELSLAHLRSTKPWVTLLSILCFLVSGFMILAGIGMAGMSLVQSGGGFPGWIGLAYLPFAGLYIYPAVKMWMYASSIGHLLVSRSTVDLEAALGQQKSFWKYCGIAAIVTILLYIVFFVGMMAYGAMMTRH